MAGRRGLRAFLPNDASLELWNRTGEPHYHEGLGSSISSVEMTSTSVTNPVHAGDVEVAGRTAAGRTAAAASSTDVAIDVTGEAYPYAVPLPHQPKDWDEDYEGDPEDLQDSRGMDIVGVVLIPIAFILVTTGIAAWIPIQICMNIVGCIRNKDPGALFGSIVFAATERVAGLYNIIFALCGQYSIVYEMNHPSAGGGPFVAFFLERLPWPTGDNHKLLTIARCSSVDYVAQATRLDNNEPDDARSIRTATASMHSALNGSLTTASDNSVLAWLKVYKQRGADLNLPNTMGETPLTVLARMGDREVKRTKSIKWLLEQGADPNITSPTTDGQYKDAVASAVYLMTSFATIEVMIEAHQKETVALLVMHDTTDMNILVGSTELTWESSVAVGKNHRTA